MKFRSIVAALATVLLASCGHMRHHPPCDCSKIAAEVDHTRPKVNVVDGKITIDQEVIVFGAGLRGVPVTVIWQLPKGSDYRFGKDGIVFKDPGDEIVRCQPIDDGAAFSCLNQHTRAGDFKYNISVQPINDKTPAVPTLDPRLVNG